MRPLMTLPSTQAPARPGDLAAWITSGDGRFLIRPTGAAPAPLPCGTIAIDAGRQFQTVRGFGFTLTGGSALLLSRMTQERRSALLQEMFAPGGPVRVSCLRLAIGASDLGVRAFTYNDVPDGESDWGLGRFDLCAGDPELLPILREILAIAPDILVMASPWSAPAWMKTNHSLVGGALRPDCHDVYARYLVRYLAEMRDRGVRVRAITVQNEPANAKHDPSMTMSAAQQAEFVGRHLGPMVRAAGLETEIFCHDHNCDDPGYPLAVLADAQARSHLAGSAFHLYAGEAEAMGLVHDRYPDKACIFTEQWVGRWDDFPGALMWHGERVLIGALRNWAEIVLEWNLAADPDCDPHTPGGEPNCVGAVTLDGDAVTRNVAYYLIAHAARFIPPGSRRIWSGGDILNAAFLTPAGQIAVIAVNPDDTPVSLTLAAQDSASPAIELPAKALATCVWTPPTP